MKVCWCTIRVRDLEKSKKFYGEVLGLSMERCFSPGPGKTIAFFRGEDGAEIELLWDDSLTELAAGKEKISIGFMTADLEAMLHRMKAQNVEILRGPLVLGGNTRCFFVSDPDGVEIQIVEKQ